MKSKQTTRFSLLLIASVCLLLTHNKALSQGVDDGGDADPGDAFTDTAPPAAGDWSPDSFLPPLGDAPTGSRGGTLDQGSSMNGPSTTRGTAVNRSSGNRATGGTANAARNQKKSMANANIEDITNENFPDTIENFDFPNADIADLVKVISELTGRNFILDQGVRGKISIIAPSKVTVAEAYKAFLSALAINGFAVVPSGKFFKIRPSRDAMRDGVENFSGDYFPTNDQLITRVIHLKHISVANVNSELRNLNSKNGEITAFTATNSIIVSDFGANVQRIVQLVNQLDVPGFEDQLKVFPVKFAKSKDLADLINRIVSRDGGNRNQGGNFSAGLPRFTRPGQGNNQGVGSANFTVIPDDRTNSLIVVGNNAGIDRVRKLLAQLDFAIKPGDQGGVNVYYVKHGSAEDIAKTLSGIVKDAGNKAGGTTAATQPPPSPFVSPVTGVQAPAEIFGSEVKITPDKNTNSLVIVASKPDYEQVLSILARLDIPREQVYIESIIMELRSGNATDWSIGYFQYDSSGSGARVGFNGFREDRLNALISSPTGSGTILGFGSGDSVTLKPPGSTQSLTVSSLVGFINFLQTNSGANILSRPQILTMDNQTGIIEVGDRVPVSQKITQGTTNSAPLQETVFDDATIKMEIKPSISPATSVVRLEVDTRIKQISTVRAPSGLQPNTQPLATRSVKTNIAVPDGDTAVLGGLMKEDELETITKVPILGDIPVLGWLFKSRNVSREKTNLLVFLTPKIIRNRTDSKEVLGKKLDQRREYIRSMGGRDPYGDTIDEIAKNKAAAETESPTKVQDDAEGIQ